MATIFETIFHRTSDVLGRRDVPVDNVDVPQVAREVAKKLAPVVTNATNQEPWWKSRIYWGLIAAALGITLSRFGINISGDDLQLLFESLGTVFQVVGVLYATYGRIVGASKPPLGG